MALIVPAHAADAQQMELNKKTVAAFYDAALNKKDFDQAAKYLGSRYTPSTIRTPRTARKGSRASSAF
jgi:predicted SnoaL-like aldol condensation-catalyzing enzyme